MIRPKNYYQPLWYDGDTVPEERCPYSDWYSSDEVEMNHVDPFNDDGRFLPFVILILWDSTTHKKSINMIKYLIDMDVSLNKWSSGQSQVKDKCYLVFFFEDKTDAAMFKLIWDSID